MPGLNISDNSGNPSVSDSQSTLVFHKRIFKINNNVLLKLNNKNIDSFNGISATSGAQLYDFNQVSETLILRNALYTKEDDEIILE